MQHCSKIDQNELILSTLTGDLRVNKRIKLLLLKLLVIVGQIPNETLKSNHYLMPTNNNRLVDDGQDKAQFYFGH